MSELEDNCPQWDEAYEVFKQLVAQEEKKIRSMQLRS